MKQYRCQVVAIEALTDIVVKVTLELPEPVSFEGGQYLQVVMGERDKRPFSIASAAASTKRLELHIGAHPENSYATEVVAQMRASGMVEVELPLGSAQLQDPVARPLILIAGGTGFSYTWSILQSYLASKQTQPIRLYWGGKTLTDLYAHEQLLELADADSRFTYHPVVEQPSSDWTGATGLVHLAVLAEQQQLEQADIYVAGRFEMVRVIRDDFVAKGVPLDHLHGDALAFI